MIRARIVLMWSVLEVTQRVPPTCTTKTSRTRGPGPAFVGGGGGRWVSIAMGQTFLPVRRPVVGKNK